MMTAKKSTWWGRVNPPSTKLLKRSPVQPGLTKRQPEKDIKVGKRIRDHLVMVLGMVLPSGGHHPKYNWQRLVD
jgi:hypothetical protein